MWRWRSSSISEILWRSMKAISWHAGSYPASWRQLSSAVEISAAANRSSRNESLAASSISHVVAAAGGRNGGNIVAYAGVSTTAAAAISLIESESLMKAVESQLKIENMAASANRENGS
jgi:hypothetical protein